MKIQKIFCNPVLKSGNNCPGGKCEPKIYMSKDEPVDKFTLSFGAKKVNITGISKEYAPLLIPEGMFKTEKKAKAFSELVEAVRTINEKNYTQAKFRKAARILMAEDDYMNTYSSVVEFIEKHDPQFASNKENLFEKWLDRKFDLLIKASESKKAIAETFLDNAAKNFEEYGYFENFHYPM